MIRNQFLIKFLGIARFQELRCALSSESKVSKTPSLGSAHVFLAVMLALLPAISGSLGSLPSDVDITTVLVGTAAVLAVMFRNRVQIPFLAVDNWKRSMHLVHTAFAIGCIPALLLVLFHPEALYLLSKPVQQDSPGVHTVIPWWLFVLQVSMWAGFTEELIYRGLLVSVLRRWSALHTQPARDLFAVTLSAFVFGLGHLSSWGPGMSMALVGLGFGLGLAYLAIGERLLPVIIYHILFDALSLSCALFSYRA